MAIIDEVARPERVTLGTEAELLYADLDYHRRLFLWKCSGLTDEQLRLQSVPPSTLSLLDLMRHLAGMERAWFVRNLQGVPEYTGRHYPLTDDGEWFAPGDTSTALEVLEDYEAATAETDAVFFAHSFDEVVASDTFGPTVTYRFIVVHAIEEYARHAGHADLLRECIDGATGE
jgi:hypothetical protein